MKGKIMKSLLIILLASIAIVPSMYGSQATQEASAKYSKQRDEWSYQSPNSQYLLKWDRFNSNITVYSTSANKVLAQFMGCEYFRFSNTSKWVLVKHKATEPYGCSHLSLCDLQNRTIKDKDFWWNYERIFTSNFDFDAGFSPKDKWMWIAGADANGERRITFFSLETTKLCQFGNKNVQAVSFDPLDDDIVTIKQKKHSTVYSLKTGRETYSYLNISSGSSTAKSSSSSAKVLAVGTSSSSNSSSAGSSSSSSSNANVKEQLEQAAKFSEHIAKVTAMGTSSSSSAAAAATKQSSSSVATLAKK